MYLNRIHAKQRERMGKSAVIVDESMMSGERVRAGKEAAMMEMDEGAVPAGPVVADKGFSDVTDLRNEDFVYVY